MLSSIALLLALVSPPHDERLLDGVWRITTGDPSRAETVWKDIVVPEAFESALGDGFDGIATYRLDFIAPTDLKGERIDLAFDAVATEAHVFLNGQLIGEHLGGWTPFRCDVTHVLKPGANQLQVMVDEKVGHDTQGFLPIVQPHFGGIWQSVRLVATANPSLDDARVLVFGDFERKKLIVEAPLVGGAKSPNIEVAIALHGVPIVRKITSERSEIDLSNEAEAGSIEAWEPLAPVLYPVSVSLLDRKGGVIDRIERNVGFRTLRADGRRILFNGHPLNVRGILEWGYYPPLRAPNRGVEEFEREIREAQARGFNLIKFCLWIPPQRLLDAMDRLGMLAWIEYPTWHPSFAEATREKLFTEFEEFFHHDRSHPSVIVRSLTCETGPSAPLEVMQSLYDKAHAEIPNAFIEDDSSWIEWNRVHDFYDDHPYGNNDQWPGTLARFEQFITDSSARKPMPLLLGEAIAADTWLDRPTVRDAEDRFRPTALAALDAWEDRFAARFGASLVPRLAIDSLRYCLNERKDQIEAFRALQPDGGYVVSVVRDFRLASMGLCDAFDRWKWRADEWDFQGDTMLLLQPGTPRSLASHDAVSLPLLVAHHGKVPLPAGTIRWSFGEEAAGEIEHQEIAPGSVVTVGTIDIDPPDVVAPFAVTLEVTLGKGQDERSNHWAFYVVPPRFESTGSDFHTTASDHGDASFIVADALSTKILDSLEQGAHVLLTTSERPGSFVAEKKWTLTGTIWMGNDPFVGEMTREFFVDLCVKDLHPTGLIPIHEIFDSIDPIVSFVASHDTGVTTDFSMLFTTRVGKGRLAVCSLPLTGNAAGEYLRSRIRDLLRERAPEHELPPDLVAAMRDKLVASTFDLTPKEWQFRIEPEGEKPGDWNPIHIGHAWEGEGYPTLDGYARYAIDLDLPADWVGKPLFMNIDGADDAYWVEFDGALAGQGGDIPNKKTAFDQKASHRLTDALTGTRHRLEIRVYDWYGAGGLHRPISLSTAPLTEKATFLRGR